MSVPIDNLKRGDWVACCHDKTYNPDNPFDRQMSFDGLPWQVKAISAPFVVCERDGVIVTMDYRTVGFTKLTRTYVLAMRPVEITQEPGSRPKSRRRKRQKAAARDPRDCPRCGQRMVQRIPSKSKQRVWHRICPDCNYDQGPVEEGSLP